MPTTYAIPDGRVAMAATLWTGDGTSSRTIVNSVNGTSFQPDWVWWKNRTTARWNQVFDSVRGADKALSTNATDAEDASGGYGGEGSVTAFNSNGYTLQGGVGNNENGSGIVGWSWKAGGAAVTNTAGSITSQVSANTTAGFSIVTYTGTGANATVGHGLGVAPNMVIVKVRGGSDNWTVYRSDFSSPANDYLQLNTTIAKSTYSVGNGIWNGGANSSTFGVGPLSAINQSANTFVAYCFAAVAGYSAFGTWQNNNSTDGTFVYLGFRPRFILLKNTDNVERWFTWDSTRQTYNMQPPSSNWLVPNDSAAEGANGATTAEIDGLSNGFKIRTTNPATGEISFGTRNYIYAAFAETAFKFSNAR